VVVDQPGLQVERANAGDDVLFLRAAAGIDADSIADVKAAGVIDLQNHIPARRALRESCRRFERAADHWAAGRQ
jgi:hypothetical protein